MFKVGDRCNWIGQQERLRYVGVKCYTGDPRYWYQFEQISAPGIVWCEVLQADLPHIEKTKD